MVADYQSLNLISSLYPETFIECNISNEYYSYFLLLFSSYQIFIRKNPLNQEWKDEGRLRIVLIT